MTGEGTRVEAINLPTTMQVSSGELRIQVSPSLAAGMTDSLTYLEHFPYECVEQTISRFLPNVITTHALKAAGFQDKTLETSLSEQVSVGLQRLYKWQNPDGGWGWWSGDKSEPLTSAYVVLGLIEAQEAGYTVDQAASGRGLNYLRTQVVFIRGLTDPQVVNRQAFILYVLARSGAPDVSSTVQLYDQRQRMALYSRALSWRRRSTPSIRATRACLPCCQILPARRSFPPPARTGKRKISTVGTGTPIRAPLRSSFRHSASSIRKIHSMPTPSAG